MGAAARRLLAAGAAVAALAAGPAGAEPVLDGWSGTNFTQDADVDIRQPGSQSDFTVHDLPFGAQSSHGAPYYGGRLAYFFGPAPARLGLALELFHFKIEGEPDATRRIAGTVRGQAVDAHLPVRTFVQRFTISNGVNYVMLDAVARYGLLVDPVEYPHGRLQLYGGIGAGPVVTYAYSTIGGVGDSSGYQLGGVGGQAFGGVRFLLWRHVGVFLEGKYTYSRLAVDVVGGGEAEVTEQGAHLLGGVSLVFP